MKKLTAPDLQLFIGCTMDREGIPNAILTGIRYLGEDIESSNEVDLLYGDDRDWPFPKDDIKHKPFLRPFSDITDEEINDVISIIYRGAPIAAKTIWRSDRKDFIIATITTEKSINQDYDTVDIEIQMNQYFEVNSILAYRNDKGTAIGYEKYYNQHRITQFLCSKQFDVFGWIEYELAIDKTKYKNKL